MRTKIASFRKGYSWTVLALALIMILCIVPEQISAQSTGSISGTVTRASYNTGIPNVYIYVYDTNWNLLRSMDSTDSSGKYTVGGLPAGSYYLRTFNNNNNSDQEYLDEYYNNVLVTGSSWPPAGATLVSVTAGSTTPNINFILPLGGSISGRVVKDSDGTGIQNVNIYVYDVHWNIFTDIVYTDSSGNYTVLGLPTGSYYLRTVYGQGYLDEYYSNVLVAGSSLPPAGATAVNVSAGQNHPLINFRLALGGSISGRVVKDSDGTGIQGVEIYVLDSNRHQLNQTVTETDSSGNYTVGSLPTGSYYLLTHNSQRYVDEYYNNVVAIGTSWPPAGATMVSVTAGSTTSNKNFSLRRKSEGIDFDGDGKTDVAVYRPSIGAWIIDPSGGGAAYRVYFGGDPSDFPVPGDYDGDGKTDIAVYRASIGAWIIDPSGGGAAYRVYFGDPSDIPVPGDYDGDGKTDVAVYRPSIGAWIINPSGGGGAYRVYFGGDPTDIPVPGDYDGDGKTDIAVYRASIGAWIINPSGGGAAYRVYFGDPSDIPVPGDYDGDGKTDVAVYRPSIGAWIINPSGGGGAYRAYFGGDPTDIPVPGDYDGDGKTDIAVYRASIGAWIINPSGGGGAYRVYFGDPNDIPVTIGLPSIY